MLRLRYKQVTSVDKLSTYAESQPQAAYAALSKSLQFEWFYLQRVLPNFGTSFAPLRDVINKKFWPSVFGGQISNSEQHLFSLSTRSLGRYIGIFDLVELQTWHALHQRHVHTWL